MTSDVQEAVKHLKELHEHLELDQISGPGSTKVLFQEQLIEAREAIEKLKTERDTIADWHAALQAADLDGIHTLLANDNIEALASFDSDAAYNEKFSEIDVGEEAELAGQQEIAHNYATEQHDDKFHAAEVALKALSPKLKHCIDSLDELL